MDKLNSATGNFTDISVNICGVTLKNPVMNASGTFGNGREYADFVDLNELGAVVVKGVSNRPWTGNPPPRIAETYGGMLNSVGLQNPGVKTFIKDDLQYLRGFDTRIIVNVCGHTLEEYIETVQILADTEVDLLELNISCPNIKEGGIGFGTQPDMAARVVEGVKKHCRQPLIVKLSPNVTDIASIAKAVENAGADGLSLINTVLGMRIDINTKKPILANGMGGLSGPAIKPIAVRAVYQVAQAVKLPIIGMGGISNADDAIEFFIAGANAVAVGTANFVNPYAMPQIVDGIKNYIHQKGEYPWTNRG